MEMAIRVMTESGEGARTLEWIFLYGLVEQWPYRRTPADVDDVSRAGGRMCPHSRGTGGGTFP
jgi:hypothetical protein